MKSLTAKYTPINCAFHDYLEHFATLKQKVEIVFIDESTREVTVIPGAIIVDLTGGRDGEYAHIEWSEGEKIIRNDFLVSVGGIKAANYNDGSCRT